jgi:hypothetical protein
LALPPDEGGLITIRRGKREGKKKERNPPFFLPTLPSPFFLTRIERQSFLWFSRILREYPTGLFTPTENDPPKNWRVLSNFEPSLGANPIPWLSDRLRLIEKGRKGKKLRFFPYPLTKRFGCSFDQGKKNSKGSTEKKKKGKKKGLTPFSPIFILSILPYSRTEDGHPRSHNLSPL